MDVTKLNEMLNERKNIVAQQREMSDKLYKDGKIDRDFNAEEQAKYDLMAADVARLTNAIQREKALGEAEGQFAAKQDEAIRAALENPSSPEGIRATPEYKKAFNMMARYGEAATPREFMATLQKAAGTPGSYLVPIEYETAIVMKMYDANIMRQLASVIRTTSQVNIPMEGNLPTPGWIDEIATYPKSDATIAQNILYAWKLGLIMQLSEELMDDAFINTGDYIAGRAAVAFGFAEEAAYIGGDGVKKPTGAATTVLASGATVTSAAPANLTSIDMFKAFYGLSRPYRLKASWLVADSAMSLLRQEKATTGQYLWMPALTANAPDMYLGRPIYTSDFLPAVAAGAVSVLFGDFSYYQIVDRVGWSMQRLNEIYAETGQIGFRMWERTDGKLLRPEAIISLTQHA